MSNNETMPETKNFDSGRIMEVIRKLNVNGNKTYHVTTFGCQMNENDSEKLAGMLNQMGYERSIDVIGSDVIIFNTCCVRENAEKRVYGHIGALKKYRTENPDAVIAVCGCMMQQTDVVEHIRKKHPHVDLVFGTYNIDRFPQMLYQVISTENRTIEILDNEVPIKEGIPVKRTDTVKAWVTIMNGCDNFCSYCVVPYVRGRERSRKSGNILSEITQLGIDGYKEVTLLGQNVNSYGKDLGNTAGFAGLLKDVNEINGIERIRFMTSHPKDISKDLVIAIRDLKKVCEHIHLPVQSGSSAVLNKMNRKYSREDYIELICDIRAILPGISLTTDIIVGFPGESESDFDETLDLMEKIRFDTAFTFIYSRRKGTVSADYQDQIPEDIKKRRFNRLIEVQNRIGREINENQVGRTFEILVDGVSKTSYRFLTGRTRTNKIVNFKGSGDLIGKIVNIQIKKAQTWSLEGVIV